VISVGNGTDFDLDSTITYFGYNMYDPNNILGFDPASYQGNNQTPPASLENLFLSIVATSENLHLEGSGHNAIDTGLNLAGSVDDDIDGNSRPIGSGWEIGADERTASVATCASTEYVFNYCESPIDISPAGTGAWVDVDVSSYMPAGATGAILHEVNTTGSARVYGVRKKGSTDTWMTQGDTSRANSHGYLMVGLDPNGVFELYQEENDVDTYLIGYTMSGATFFTNAVDKSIGTTAAWTDVDISSDTGADTAIGAIFIVRNTLAGDVLGGVRKNGSTDDFYHEVDHGDAHVALVGVDGNEVAEMKIATTDLDLYLMGYVTSLYERSGQEHGNRRQLRGCRHHWRYRKR
jgi:hypothetical protein